MSRIFVGLAFLNALALSVSFGVGFLSTPRVGLEVDTAAQVLWPFTVHLMAGLLAALLTLLVHSLVFTYFIGTGRWVQEVVAAYRLPSRFWDESRHLKLRTLPFILGSIALVITTATLGAATDRGMADRNFHLLAAMSAIAFNLWSYVWEFQSLKANGELIASIMSEVTRMREERGLTVASNTKGNAPGTDLKSANTSGVAQALSEDR